MSATTSSPTQARRLSGVSNAASRIGQRVSTVLKPPLAVKPPSSANPSPIAATTPSPSSSTSEPTLHDQVLALSRMSIVPLRGSALRRVAVCRAEIRGLHSAFSLCVHSGLRFDVTLENGAQLGVLEMCTVVCSNVELLNARGKMCVSAATGVVTLPVFAKMNGVGGWLPHYPVTVLVHLLLRIVLDEGLDVEIAQAASLGSPGFELVVGFGTGSLKGKRIFMEDFKFHSPSQKLIRLFGVFDGHGGAAAANLACELFESTFYSYFTPSFEGSSRISYARKALRSTIEDIEKKIIAKEKSGTTACIAAVDFETRVLHCVNVGDTRCVVCRDGVALDVSTDHKASHPQEMARIVEAGGFVARSRALGVLAISRALGDRELKRGVGNEPSPVSADPDVETLVLDPCRDEFCVIACDGLFDVMTSEQVVAFVRNKLAEGLSEDATSEALAMHAINNLRSLDNVTVTLCVFSWAMSSSSSESTNSNTPRAVRAPTIRRTESATTRAARASAHKRQSSRMSSTESNGSTTVVIGVNLLNSLPGATANSAF